MKKTILVWIMLGMCLTTACGEKEESTNESNVKEQKVKTESNGSRYDEFVEKVVDKEWFRGTTGCTEYIYFAEDGSYGYYEACGNPVGNHDLYETWEYNEKKDIIKVSGGFMSSTNIEYISCDGEELVLVVDDEERTFLFSEDFSNYTDDDSEDLEMQVDSKEMVFAFGVVGMYWVQETEEGNNELSFIWSDEEWLGRFNYTTSTGEKVSGYEEFEIYEYDSEKDCIVIKSMDGSISMDIDFDFGTDGELILYMEEEEIVLESKY